MLAQTPSDSPAFWASPTVWAVTIAIVAVVAIAAIAIFRRRRTAELHDRF